MSFISFLTVAAAAFLLGFLLGFTFGGKGGGVKAPFKPFVKRTSISREFENFLTYDGSVQK